METPLHVAAQFGNEKIARLLIEKGADLKVQSANRATALHHACARGDVKLVQLLLEKGAKFELNENASDLIYASDNDEVFGMLLDSVDQKRLAGPLGTEVLASIAQTTRKHAIELLLARGAKPDIFTACRLGQLEHVRAAVEANPSVIKTISGAMELAAVNGHVEVLEFLISKGAEIDPAKLEGISLLHSAASHGHQQVVDLLIRQGLKLDGRTEQGATLLHAAATGVQTEIVRFLLSQGADVHAVDFSRNTPLHVLCGWQSLYDESERSEPKIIEREVETARLFIEAGADVNAKDNLGCTPLHDATGYGRNGTGISVSRLLKST